MSDPILTRHNPLLSRPTMAAVPAPQPIANPTLTPAVNEYVRDSLATNTRRAYLSDLAEFERCGGSIPASPETLAAYLAARASTLAVATLVRHLASISKAHEARGLPNPTRSELGRVDGFDQDECTCQCDERTIILRCLLATQCDALESFEFADCLLDTGAALVENLWKEGGLVFDVGSIWITGHIPRWRAASRFDLES